MKHRGVLGIDPVVLEEWLADFSFRGGVDRRMGIM